MMSLLVESMPEMRKVYVVPCQRVWQRLYHSTDNFLLIAFLLMYNPLFLSHTYGDFAQLALQHMRMSVTMYFVTGVVSY